MKFRTNSVLVLIAIAALVVVAANQAAAPKIASAVGTNVKNIDTTEPAPIVTFPTTEEIDAYFTSLDETNDLIRFSLGGPTVSEYEEAISGNTLYITWADESGNIRLAVSRDDGITWSKPALLSNTGKSSEPVIAATGENVMVTWQENDTPKQIYASTSADMGQTFKTYDLSNSNTNAIRPEMYTTQNQVYALWLAQDDNGQFQLVGHRGW